MLGHEPHHQGHRPRLGADLRRQGRRERAVHGREPDVCSLRIRARDGRERRQLEPAGAAGWFLEECVECAALMGGGVWCTCWRSGEEMNEVEMADGCTEGEEVFERSV